MNYYNTLAAASKQSSPFFFNKQIASAGFIHPLTNKLSYLFNPIVVITLTVAIVSLMLFFLVNTSFQFYSFINTGLTSILIFGSLYFVSVIFHELGHASACRYYGVEHGHIGVGLYLHFPVFYADVSNIWKLKRHQRVAVDVTGIYFQSIFLIPIILIYFYTNLIILEYLIYAITISLLFDLNPFFKFDGYWIWSDLLGIPNLRKRTVEIITYIINRLKGKTNNEIPYLFKIKKMEKLGLVVYTVLVNIFFAYYLLYRMPIFIFHSISSAPDLLDQIARSSDNKLNLIVSLVLQILILLLMIYFLIRVAMLLKNEMNSESIIEKLFFELQPDTDKKSKWKTAFKIRVYQNSNGVPGHDLILENIALSAEKNSKLLSVDVSKYSLVLPTNGVFIGVDFIGYFDNENNFIPYSTSKRPLNLRLTFTNQDASNTYSKFFGTKWRLVTHKKMNGEVTNINAKFGAKISY